MDARGGGSEDGDGRDSQCASGVDQSRIAADGERGKRENGERFADGVSGGVDALRGSGDLARQTALPGTAEEHGSQACCREPAGQIGDVAGGPDLRRPFGA